MAVLTISLSEDRQAFLDEEIAAGRYKSASDAIEAMILMEELRKNQDTIDELLLEAENEPDELLVDSSAFRETRRLELEEFIRTECGK